jgi:hypothetical protein
MPSVSDSDLDALLDRLPILTGQPRRIEELPGGLAKRNVKIITATGSYVARCSTNSGNLLGVPR